MRNLFVLVLILIAGAARADRLKDLVDVDGFRTNPLTGVGLVVGLAGTGDDGASAAVVAPPMAAMLKRLGVTIDPSVIKAKNVALVTITADLPPFARPGMHFDVTVSSIGTAKSLQGGTLLAAELKGADLQTYALAQGALSVGGLATSGSSGSSETKNHPTVAMLPSGGVIERDAPGSVPDGKLVLLLRRPDATTASRIADSIDKSLGDGAAIVRDPAAVVVPIGDSWRGRAVELVAALGDLQADPDLPARVVIDERTGTIVIGAGVTLSAAAVASGELTVQISETPVASQPAPLAKGQTVVTPQTSVQVHEGEGAVHVLNQTATVGDVADALNSLGVKPRALIGILQALSRAGALHAELVIQ